MKKIILLLIGGIILSSCGGDKKKETTEIPEIQDEYVVVMDAIYEKDDSIAVVYEKEGFYKYDAPSTAVIKGSPAMQRIIINLPVGETVENVSIVGSTNKTQGFITIKNISIINKKDTINGDNYKFTENFSLDESFTWDEANARYNLNHSNKYPPGVVGNDNLKALLLK